MNRDEHIARLDKAKSTQLFQIYQQLCRDFISVLKLHFSQPIDRIRITETARIQSAVKHYIQIIHHIVSIGKIDNPYQSISPIVVSHETQLLCYQLDGEERYKYYLQVLLPSIVGEQYFQIIKYDLIDPIAPLIEICRFLIKLKTSKNDESQNLIEMIDIGNRFINKFKIIVDAAAEFERQQFGEVTDE